MLIDGESSSSSLLGKRRCKTDLFFLRKRPRFEQIDLEAKLKKEIEVMMEEYFAKFERSSIMKKFVNTAPNAECQRVMRDSFSILLLSHYYDNADFELARQQTWAYLESVFNVHEKNSLAHSILSNKNAATIINLFRKFLTNTLFEKFKAEFDRKIRLCVDLRTDELSPLLERDILHCRCGFNGAAGGPKIRCSKCGTYQHRKCVGLSLEFEVDDYCCPKCSPIIESGATLIVVPPNLMQQWITEVRILTIRRKERTALTCSH